MSHIDANDTPPSSVTLAEQQSTADLSAVTDLQTVEYSGELYPSVSGLIEEEEARLTFESDFVMKYVEARASRNAANFANGVSQGAKDKGSSAPACAYQSSPSATAGGSPPSSVAAAVATLAAAAAKGSSTNDPLLRRSQALDQEAATATPGTPSTSHPPSSLPGAYAEAPVSLDAARRPPPITNGSFRTATTSSDTGPQDDLSSNFNQNPGLISAGSIEAHVVDEESLLEQFRQQIKSEAVSAEVVNFQGNKDSEITTKKRTVLAIALCALLGVAALIVGFVVGMTNKSSNNEEIGPAPLDLSKYESIANALLLGVQKNIRDKIGVGEAIASIFAIDFPDAEEWPFVARPGYVETVDSVAQISSSVSIAMIPLVTPDDGEAEMWQEFARDYYRETGYPETAGVSEFGFGIWANDASEPKLYSDGRVPDISGETSYNSTNKVLFPIFQHNKGNSKSLLLNVHANKFRGCAIDSILACSSERTSTDKPSGEEDSKPRNCAVVTDRVELVVRPGPAALLYQPIYPKNDPDVLVGVMGSSMHWEEILSNVVYPSSEKEDVTGLACVVSSSETAFTFLIEDGMPMFLGDGDLHDPSFAALARTLLVNDNSRSGAEASIAYNLTVYPTSDYPFSI